MKEIILKILNDSDRKNYFRIGIDLSRLFLKYNKYMAVQTYSSNLMFKKNSGKIKDYLCRENYMRFIQDHYRNKDKESLLLNDKIALSAFLKTHGIPTTRNIGKIQNKSFYDENNKVISFNNKFQLRQALEETLEVYSSVFIKQADGLGGKSDFKVSKKNLNVLDKLNLNYNYIIEETLIQHPYISSINPGCVNTLRVHSYREGNNLYFPTCYLRMGVSNSFVDNVSSGGLFITYDIYKNELNNVAYRLFEFGGQSFFEHPDTGFKFEGKQLIFAEDIIKIITRAALLFEKKLIGWDIAFTQDGVVIVEGNHNPHVPLMQISAKGLLAEPIFKKVFQKYI